MTFPKLLVGALLFATLLAPQATSADEIDPGAQEFLEWHYAHYEELFPGTGHYVLRTEAQGIRDYLQFMYVESWRPVLDCIAYYESEGRGTYPIGSGYGAENPRSSASGRYQMVQRTSNTVARWMGWPHLIGVPASQWAPHEQDLGAIKLIEVMGMGPWSGRGHCYGRRA